MISGAGLSLWPSVVGSTIPDNLKRCGAVWIGRPAAPGDAKLSIQNGSSYGI
jgi:hypothetical protein